jgi:NADP-reducing hydrogenase subunit HndC
MSYIRSQILVCDGTEKGTLAQKSSLVATVFRSHLEDSGLGEEIQVIETGNLGLYSEGVIVIVHPENVYYENVKPTDVAEIVEEHLLKGRPVERLMMADQADASKKVIGSLQEIGFYKKQKRIVLRNCGVINPESIEEYIAVGGYEALGRALTEQTPQEIIDIIKASGLRGRGGAGFPTGQKWQFTHDATSEDGVKYVCCNADEGDPGAFMDRSVLEGDPFSVIEAMTIAAYAVGAHQGYIYVRAEYPIAVRRLNIAINQAKEYGLLGENIFETGFDFQLETRLGAGAFVCGEETALLVSIEGHRGEPRSRPPFPAVKGLWQRPTLLNNVETYANITWILNNGAEAFSAIGTEKSKGTKVFALGGKINRPGLVEIPMGTTLREIIYDIGGGIPNGKAFKAAQTGGPSGGCIPASLIDTPIDYDSLTAIGSMMGSGGLIVMDEDNCMVDIAKFFLEFVVDESCGKCTPCRVGTRRLLELLTKITDGRGTPEDLDRVEKLSASIKSTALCALGQSAPNPVLSTLRYFREEYEAHVNQKTCPTGVCKNLVTYTIDADRCRGCTLCARNCPADAITGQVRAAHEIDQDKCVKCGTCLNNCKFGAIRKN